MNKQQKNYIKLEESIIKIDYLHQSFSIIYP